MVKGENVVNVLSEYDILFLPTKGENFGHVIVEALAAGIIVLTSDQVPQNDLEENNCGFNFHLSKSKNFINCLKSLNEDFSLVNIMKQSSRIYYEKKYLQTGALRIKYLRNL